MCLSETKCDKLDHNIEGFTPFFKPRPKKKTHGGFHGLCILVKSAIAKHCSLVKNTKAEAILWLKISKKVVGLHVDMVLGASYVPCENSIHFIADIFDDIIEDIVEINAIYHGLPFTVIGDTNARTADLPDFIELDGSTHEKLDMNTMYIDYGKRINTDKVVNSCK